MEKKCVYNDFMLLAFKTFLENSQDIVFVKDINLKYVGTSRSFALLAGCINVSDLYLKNDYDIFGETFAEKYVKEDMALLKSGTSNVNIIELLERKDRTKRYISTSKYAVKDENDTVVGIYGIKHDITAEIELEAEKEYRAFSNHIFDDFLEADLTNDHIFNTEGSKLFRSLNTHIPESFASFIDILASDFLHRDQADEFKNRCSVSNLKADFENGIKKFQMIVSLRSDNMICKWTEITAKIYSSKISKTLNLILFLKDLDEEEKEKRQLQRSASYDALTGLLNRKSVTEKIEECLLNGKNHDKHALLFIDLDYFKLVNDNLGHPFGDRILKETAKKLKTLFRESDIVGRFGGDEFLVLLRNVSSKKDIEIKSQRVLDELPFCYMENDFEICVTCSIGIATCDGRRKTFDQMYEEADRAMYKAKKDGKNRMAFSE